MRAFMFYSDKCSKWPSDLNEEVHMYCLHGRLHVTVVHGAPMFGPLATVDVHDVRECDGYCRRRSRFRNMSRKVVLRRKVARRIHEGVSEAGYYRFLLPASPHG